MIAASYAQGASAVSKASIAPTEWSNYNVSAWAVSALGSGRYRLLREAFHFSAHRGLFGVRLCSSLASPSTAINSGHQQTFRSGKLRHVLQRGRLDVVLGKNAEFRILQASLHQYFPH